MMPKSHPRLADILKPEDNNFGALRLAMALAVLVSHSYWFATAQVTLEPLKLWTGYTLGEHAVQVFFFLSGVVVAQSILTRGDLLDFAVARMLRIFPALIVCVLATALLLGPWVTALPVGQYLTDGGVLAYIVRTLSLSTGSAPLPGVFADLPVANAVNLSLWTLKYEVACYILLALFGIAFLKLERLRPVLVMLLALVVILAFAGSIRPVEPLSGQGSLRYFIVFFFLGTLAYLAREVLIISWLGLPPLFALFVIAIGTPFAELASSLFLGYATLCVAALPLSRVRRFTNSQDYSYGVYILHGPIQQLLITMMPGIGPVALTVFALLVTLPLSALSWNVVERPAMRRRQALIACIEAMARGLRGWRRLSSLPRAARRSASGPDRAGTAPAIVAPSIHSKGRVAHQFAQPIPGGFRR